jgi:SnoaL-like protein
MNDAMVDLLLGDFCAAFSARDVERVLDMFSEAPKATYAGSEVGEKAAGPVELRRLFTELFARDAVYTFTFPAVTHALIGAGVAWILAEGEGTESRPQAAPVVFAYRIVGILVLERLKWRWAVLSGSEPSMAG